MAKKIILISPESSLMEEFIELLSQDFEILKANDEDQGFQLLDNRLEEIAAILIDLSLTRSTDFKIIRKMSEDMIFAHVPVIAIFYLLSRILMNITTLTVPKRSFGKPFHACWTTMIKRGKVMISICR